MVFVYLYAMRVAIIGAGVAGLSAGCYLQMNGFETEIFEAGSSPGGLCRSWERGGYRFNGGLHWLLGSNESSPFYHLWSELIDMRSLHFTHHEVRMVVETKTTLNPSGDHSFILYTNIEKLNRYLNELAPEDKYQISAFIRQIRKIQSYEIPPLIRSVPRLLPFWKKIKYIEFLPELLFLKRYQKVTNRSFARKLKNPFLREAFELLFDGDEIPLLVITMPLAFYDTKGAGYLLGGSGELVDKIVGKYTGLNGKIRFNSRVERILTVKDRVEALLLQDGSRIAADIIVSAADWRFTFHDALGANFVTRRIESLLSGQNLQPYYSVFVVYIGVKGNFADLPPVLRYPLKTPITSPDGTKYDRMEMQVYNYDPGTAPAGKTVISLTLYTRKGNYWIGLRRDDRERYDREKNEFAQVIIETADQRIGRIRGFIEELDISTPATIHRYTNNWMGSTQGWLPSNNLIAPSPVEQEIKGLKNFYYAGHWSIPGGGLPVAIKSARDVAMMICDKTGRSFKTSGITS